MANLLKSICPVTIVIISISSLIGQAHDILSRIFRAPIYEFFVLIFSNAQNWEKKYHIWPIRYIFVFFCNWEIDFYSKDSWKHVVNSIIVYSMTMDLCRVGMIPMTARLSPPQWMELQAWKADIWLRIDENGFISFFFFFMKKMWQKIILHIWNSKYWKIGI